MILDSTSKSVTVVLGEATSTTESDLTAAYTDIQMCNSTWIGNDTVTNGMTAVTLVASPAASTQRIVKEITITNQDTVIHTYFMNLVDGSNTRAFQTVILSPGQSFQYRSSGSQYTGLMGSQSYVPTDISGASPPLVFPLTEGYYNRVICGCNILILQGEAEYPATTDTHNAEIAFPAAALKPYFSPPDIQGLNLGGTLVTIGGPTGIHARFGFGYGFLVENDGTNSLVTNAQLSGCKLRWTLFVLMS